MHTSLGSAYDIHRGVLRVQLMHHKDLYLLLDLVAVRAELAPGFTGRVPHFSPRAGGHPAGAARGRSGRFGRCAARAYFHELSTAFAAKTLGFGGAQNHRGLLHRTTLIN